MYSSDVGCIPSTKISIKDMSMIGYAIHSSDIGGISSPIYNNIMIAVGYTFIITNPLVR